MAVMTKRSKVRKWSQNRAFVTNFYTRYVDLGLNWFPRCSHIIFVLFLSHLRDGTLGYPWDTPGIPLAKTSKNIIPETFTTKVHEKIKQVCMEASAQPSKMVFRLHETTVSMNALNVQK